jgi:ribulose-5-phosphate 4-epimerase/fuculose-1-phosphate aldolase
VTPLDEPAHEAIRLCHLARSLFDRGLTPGRSGNLSARLADNSVLVTPSGSSLRDLMPSGLSRVSPHGVLVSGPEPSKETFLHLAIYRARPETHAVAHTHSTHATAISCLADRDPQNVLPSLTGYYAMRVARLPLLPYHPPGDQALGPRAEAAARDHHALLLANHGPIAAGRDIEDAVVIEEIEEAARLFFILNGQPRRTLTTETSVGDRHQQPTPRV